jgi:hypothetical protein
MLKTDNHAALYYVLMIHMYIVCRLDRIIKLGYTFLAPNDNNHWSFGNCEKSRQRPSEQLMHGNDGTLYRAVNEPSIYSPHYNDS